MQLPSLEGRGILPVRLIPFVTGFNVGPHSLAKLLAHKQGLAWPVFRPEDKLFAYQLDFQGKAARLLPKEWDSFVADMEILEKRLKTQERFEDEKYPAWRCEAVKLLPARVFVWREEFEAVFQASFNRNMLAYAGRERAGSRELNFAPYIPPNFRTVVWEGFETFRSAGPATGKPLRRGENPPSDEMVPEILVGYADFLRLCRVDDPVDWAPGFQVATDGVWIEPPQGALLTRGERAALSEHPDKNLSKPALPFPCTLRQLQTFQEWAGLYGCIDPFDMAEFVRKEVESGKASGITSAGTPSKKSSTKEINTLLKLVISMAVKGYRYDPRASKSPIPTEIAADAEQVGLSIDADTVRKWLKQGGELLPSGWNEKE